MTPEQRKKEYRRRAAGAALIGGTLLGAGAGVNMAADKQMERKKLQKPLRAALKGKFKPAHVAYLATRGVGRSLQIAGIPIAAAGAYGVYRPKKIERVDFKRGVVDPVRRAITFETEAERGRKVINAFKARNVEKASQAKLTRPEATELVQRKERQKRLSQVSGALGIAALGLRTPEAAKFVARKSPKLAARLNRVGRFEPQATKASNTLGIGAIGVGSLGSFNFARIQGTEAKAEQRAINKQEDKKRDKRKVVAGAALGAGALALTPVPVRIPRESNNTNRRISGQVGSGFVDPKQLQRVSTGPGGRFGESRQVARVAQSLSGGFDEKRPVTLTRYKNNQYVLTGGHHRVEAAQRLGMGSVPTRVVDAKGSARSWMPLASAVRYKSDVRSNRARSIKPQHPNQIRREAASYMPKWKDRANALKSVTEDFARSKSAKVALGGAAVGAGIYGGAKLKERMAKSAPIIWVNTLEQQSAVLARNPDARVMMRPPKQKSGETKEQRKQRQAAQPKKVEFVKPAPAVVKPTKLHRLSGKKFPGGRVGAGLALVGTGAGAGILAGRLSKSDELKSAGAGAAGAYGAYLTSGYGLSAMAQRARKGDKVSQKSMFEHRKKSGISPSGSLRSAATKKQIEQFNRTMPADVKFSGLTRTLARTHGVSPFGRMAVPVIAAGGVAGTAYSKVKKDAFLDKNRNFISPNAERGYKYLKRGRNESAVISGVGAGLGALTAIDAAKAIGAKRYGRAAVSGVLTGVNAYTSAKSGARAKRWDSKIDRIKDKAAERKQLGIYGKDRNVDVAKAFSKGINPRFGKPFPVRLRRKAAVRDGGIRRTPTGRIVSFRGSIG
jgi:hypothetical protein